MQEQTVTNSTALSSALGLALILPNLDGSSLLAALCGAALLILSKEQIKPLKALILFVVAFVLGLLFADFGSAVLAFFLPQALSAKIPTGGGALLVSLSVTQGALLLLKQDFVTLINLLKNKGEK